MASQKTSPRAQPPRGGGGKDRLSNLPAGVLGTILSFLPTKESGRAAALCRSWRHTFAGVDTISFVQGESHDNYDHSFTGGSKEKRSENGGFINKVNAALLCHRRCGSDAAPRVFRVHFGRYDSWDEAMLNRWLYHVLNRCTHELHLDLRLQHTEIGDHQVKEPYNDDDEDIDSDADVPPDDKCPRYSVYRAHVYSLPRTLFSCVAIRTLCLAACSLEPPELIHLPFLETLVLCTIKSTGNNIQRLISGCPRLVDLTLERCGYTDRHCYRNPLPDKNFTITVLDKHLRRLALRCCHNLVRASIDASELLVFEYRGDVPSESLLNLHGAHKISWCTLGFCGKKVYKGELPRFRNFLEQLTGTKQLLLLSTHLGSQIQSKFFMRFPSFSRLVRLELRGYLGGRSIDAVTRILEQAPSVEILSLFMKPCVKGKFHNVWTYELVNDPTVPDVSISCLRNRVREINLVHYQGHKAQRYMAKLLLCNAVVLERVCVVIPRGPRELQMRLKNQIEGWLVDRSTEMIFF